ncbi:MAG: hypothetical protein QXU73_05330 [Thermoplasmata archaeon]
MNDHKPTVVSAKVDRTLAEAVRRAVREHPERFRDASSLVREAVVALLRSLGYTEA